MTASSGSSDKRWGSRFAQYVPNPLATGTSANSASSGGSPASGTGSGKAQDVLEALATMHLGRARHQSADRVRATDKSTSREREREGPRARASSEADRGDPDSAGLFGSPGVESPRPIARQLASGVYGSGYGAGSVAGSSGMWGGESLPHNASAFSTFAPGSSSFFNADESHFFAPGGGFSFEGEGDSPSSASGAAFGFRDRGARLAHPDASVEAPWDSYSANGAQSGGSFRKTAKERTRSLRYAISADRGIVELAKPRENHDGTVAIAGKTYLRLLKVPPRDSLPPLEPPPSFAANSSIASRRSRSRGSPGPMDRASQSSSAERQADQAEVVELHDLRSGSKLGPGYLFTDVRWGYGETSNKIATSFSNGAVALWDLEKEGASRLELMNQHERAVNQVIFGGPNGNYLLSAGQDGNIKLWDIRLGRASTNTLKASSPVQRIAFSPSISQPWTLLAVCTSGTMVRFDLRNLGSGKPSGAMTDRVAGHIGACLAMDWRDNYDSDGADRKEGGWVVTGGMDRTIKIWDFSLVTLSTRPMRTLYSSQPVQNVAWHPSRGTELASSPMPVLGAGVEDIAGGSSASLDSFKDRLATASFSKTEIEIWDTRRVAFPMLSIKTEDSISAMMYNDDETIWATSKSSPTFHQFDVAKDSYSLLSSAPTAGAAWNADGSLWFSGASPSATGSTLDDQEGASVDAPKFLPDVSLAAVADIDSDFSATDFADLAHNLVLSGDDFGYICDQNADAYRDVSRPDSAQLWQTIKIWLHDRPLEFPDSPPETSPLHDLEPATTEPEPRLGEWLPAPVPGVPGGRSMTKSTSRRSFSVTRSHDALARVVRSSTHSPVVLPVDLHKPMMLVPFSEESGASDSDAAVARKRSLPTLSSDQVSSDSEQDRRVRLAGKLPPSLSLAATQASRARSATLSTLTALTSLGDLAVPPDDFSLPPSASHSRGPSSSSGSDSEEERSGHFARARAAKIMAKQAPGMSSRRTSSNASLDRSKWRARGPETSVGRQASRTTSADRLVGNASRKGSIAPIERVRDAVPAVTARKGPTTAKLAKEASLKHFSEARGIVKAQIKEYLQEYADKGDSQLCATVCCVLKNIGMEFDALFVSRCSKAYLNLLRRAQLYTAAAGLIKNCASAPISALSQTNVVFHTACGKCGKALEKSPSFGFCARCSSHQPTRCCICHLVVRSLIILCAACGHGAHPRCLDDFAATLSALALEDSRPSCAAVESFPSTPGIVTPGTRMWMWGETEGETSDERARTHRRELPDLLTTCPAGACGHSPCMVSALVDLGE